MRTREEIDADITRAEAVLRKLHAERRASLGSRRERVIAAFDELGTILATSERTRIPYYAVQGILYRAGRTEKGREATKRRIRAATQTDQQASP